MRISSKRLIGLPVRTKMGVVLGHVSSLEIETDHGRVETLRIKPVGLMKGLTGEEAFITWAQIIEIHEDQVIVSDATSSERALATAKIASSVPAAMASELQEE